MKTKLIILAFFTSLISSTTFAQDKTTVTATNNDISDNLDLRAVASIFGESENLEDFERRLNDPKTQISNLDLNGDNQVDYLRVIESVESNTHLVIIQAVLQKDVFQDVATVEIEKDANNQVQVQVVGDVYMYGNNYIYEPVYVRNPVIYDYFWASNYHPYYSSWYWGYYPSYYYAWNPWPIYRYRNNVNVYINTNNHYNYVNVRRSQRAAALHNVRRGNGYEVMHPNRSFTQRNSVRNRYELDQVRNTSSGTRTTINNGSGTVRNTSATRSNSTRSNSTTTSQANGTRATTAGTRSYTGTRSVTTSSPTRATSSSTRAQNPANTTVSQPTRNSQPTRTAPAPVSTPRPTVTATAPNTRAAAPNVSPQRSNPQPTVQPQRSNNTAPTRNAAPAQQSNQQKASNGRR